MTKRFKLGFGIGLAVVLVALITGAALAQQGTPVPGTMMGGTPMPGTMMGGTPMPGSMMRGTAMPGRMVTGTMPGAMGPMMDDDMDGMMVQMMAGHGMTGTMSGMGGMMGMMMQHMMGMMGGMMGNNGMMGGGMMNGMSGGWSDPNAKPLTVDQAISATQTYIKSLPNNAGAGLAPLEIMEFSNGFYAAVGDKNGGAFEVLIDRYTGQVRPEPGPNMMWNTKYGMMGSAMMGQGGMSGMMGGGMMGQGGGMSGMMGGGMMGQGGGMMGLWTPPAAAPTVSVSQARTYAQQFLDLKFPGAQLPQDTLTFPGYYTLDFEVNGQPAGMLSVNAYTGQVWYHTWHGQFLSERMPGSKTM
jgi:hypothetical protein